ncbi:MAG: GatB/YqeY domain-containing protein [Pelagibacteraceae bacterium]|jgi:hypothetical protein|nr:GatB/YqeY domain-containing protein [Pelagibacteraceae bacterium]MBO6492182.1 GatB/YqeY domain-containing protein [Pelagibacteraceae bacterium]
MSLRIEIETKLQGALKERNKLEISTLRLILAAVKDRDIASRTPDNRAGIKDEDIKQLLKKMIKQRNESIEIYKKNNRIDLLEIEKGEVEIISTFLPKQLNETEITKVCKEAIQSIKAQEPKDIGKVMGVLKKKYSDILDFAKAGEQVKEILK